MLLPSLLVATSARAATHQLATWDFTKLSIHEWLQETGFKKFARKEVEAPGVCTETRLNKAVGTKGTRNAPYKLDSLENVSLGACHHFQKIIASVFIETTC